MPKNIEFKLVDATPPALVQFKEAPGVNSKKAVCVTVSQGKKNVFGSTGFDAAACAMFSALYGLGVGFSGFLYADEKVVGDVVIGKDADGLPYLQLQLGTAVHAARLLDADIDELTALFVEIGGVNE
jgi:hypothetical protein